jgi:putative transposase
MLEDRLGRSERRACQIAGQHRSTQRREPQHAPDDGALRGRLRAISRERPRWGYRRAHARLVEEGWALNQKRTQRLWREEGLAGPCPAAQAPAPGRVHRPSRPIAWPLSVPTMCGRSTSSLTRPPTGRILKLLHVVDEFTREALAIECVGAGGKLTPLRRLRMHPFEDGGGGVRGVDEPGSIVIDRDWGTERVRGGAVGRVAARAFCSRGVDQGARAALWDRSQHRSPRVAR